MYDQVVSETVTKKIFQMDIGIQRPLQASPHDSFSAEHSSEAMGR